MHLVPARKRERERERGIGDTKCKKYVMIKGSPPETSLGKKHILPKFQLYALVLFREMKLSYFS